MEPRFITNYPAVLVGDTLVIADLHIGVEFEFYSAGIKIPSNTDKMKETIIKLIKITKAKNLLIVGDIKHKVPGISKQELREIPSFLQTLSDFVKVEIILGNHDGGLKDYIPDNVKLHTSKGLLKNDCYFLHGHTWPSPAFIKCSYLFVGHEHPQIEFCDALGYRFTEQVWVHAELEKEKIKNKYKIRFSSLPKLIIIPHFNRLSGGISLNLPSKYVKEARKEMRIGMGPIVRSAKLSSSKIYLLDGTFLGELKKL
jgi:putative SbcD/Mre11-related phosphoesterase